MIFYQYHGNCPMQDEPRSEGVPLKGKNEERKKCSLLVRTQRTQINKNYSG